MNEIEQLRVKFWTDAFYLYHEEVSRNPKLSDAISFADEALKEFDKRFEIK